MESKNIFKMARNRLKYSFLTIQKRQNLKFLRGCAPGPLWRGLQCPQTPKSIIIFFDTCILSTIYYTSVIATLNDCNCLNLEKSCHVKNLIYKNALMIGYHFVNHLILGRNLNATNISDVSSIPHIIENFIK